MVYIAKEHKDLVCDSKITCFSYILQSTPVERCMYLQSTVFTENAELLKAIFSLPKNGFELHPN